MCGASLESREAPTPAEPDIRKWMVRGPSCGARGARIAEIVKSPIGFRRMWRLIQK